MFWAFLVGVLAVLIFVAGFVFGMKFNPDYDISIKNRPPYRLTNYTPLTPPDSKTE